MISKHFTCLVFSLIFLMPVMASGQGIERNPKEVYFEVGKDESITEWLVIGSFPGDLGTDFLQSAGGESKVRPYEGMTVTAPDGKTYTWKRYHRPRYSSINLRDALKQFLFSLEPTFQSELDSLTLRPSEDLQRAFEKSGVSLSPNATIVIIKKGDQWRIIDEENQKWYLIMKTKPQAHQEQEKEAEPAPADGKSEEALKIYLEPKNGVAYAACNLLSPKDQRLEIVLSGGDG
ncbi:hypothetical protein HYR99_23180, partial [Candidatus Poribacteria bacterium]|nr:hypothetical protein [Candidatus Poribacteria bacterium]